MASYSLQVAYHIFHDFKGKGHNYGIVIIPVPASVPLPPYFRHWLHTPDERNLGLRRLDLPGICENHFTLKLYLIVLL